jgi:hypothetical protein
MALCVQVEPWLEQPHLSESVVDAAKWEECTYLSDRI